MISVFLFVIFLVLRSFLKLLFALFIMTILSFQSLHFSQFTQAVLYDYNLITTIAGDGTEAFAGDGGLASLASLWLPEGVSVDANDDVYIADYANNRIRKVDTSSGLISTVAGNGSAYSTDGGLATSSGIGAARCVFVADNGDIFIGSGFRVLKVDGATGILTHIAGASSGYAGDGGLATAAALSQVRGVVVDSNGNIYVADGFNNVIRRVDASTGIISTYAGTGVSGFSGDGGPAASAQLNIPMHMDIDASDSLYIADVFNRRVRKINTSTGIITTLAGNGDAPGVSDVPATTTGIGYIEGVAVDTNGEVYIADNLYSLLKVETSGVLRRLGGSGSGFGGDGGPVSAAQFNRVIDVDLDSNGNLYVVDEQNDRIRKVSVNTGTAPDLGVLSTSPVQGAAGVAKNSTLQIVFDETVNIGDFTNSSFRVWGKHSGLHAGNFAFSTTTKTNDTVTFTPTSPFFMSEEVSVSVTSAITDVTGGVLHQGFSFSFFVQTDSTLANLSLSQNPTVVGISPIIHCIADLDNDGDDDVVNANISSATIGVFLNDGTGTLAPQVSYAVTGLHDPDCSDIDNDGDVDVVASSFISGRLGVLFNNGNGTFGSATYYGSVTNPYLLTSADVDADGDIDFFSSSYSDTMTAYINDGSGVFTATNYPVSSDSGHIRGIDVMDFDGDGNQDVLTLNNSGNGDISVFYGNGDGTFQAKQVALSPGVSGSYLKVLDVDQDGDIDILAFSGGVKVYKNDGSYNFSLSGTYPVSSYIEPDFGDIDADGDLDIVTISIGNFVRLYANDGTGAFSQSGSVAVGGVTNATAVQLSDLNLDGELDVVVVDGNNHQMAVLLSSSNQPPVVTTPSSIVQSTDASGFVTFQTTVSDADNDPTTLQVQYSDDGGATFYDAQLVSAIPDSGSVDLDNAQTYQVGSVNPIDTDGGAKTLTLVWDTQSSANGNGIVTGEQSDIRLRVIANDATTVSIAQTSGSFTIDNQNPVGLTALNELSATLDQIELGWSAVTETAFDHYEIWYGESQSDVVNRTGTALEWDAADDPQMANISTSMTTITGLDPGKSYYFKIFAVDQFGNTHTILEVSLDTAVAGGRRRLPVSPIEGSIGTDSNELIVDVTVSDEMSEMSSEAVTGTSYGAAEQQVLEMEDSLLGDFQRLYEWMRPKDYELTIHSLRLLSQTQYVFQTKWFMRSLATALNLSDGYVLSKPLQEPLQNFAELFKTLMVSFSDCFSKSDHQRALSHDVPDNGWWWAGYWYFLGDSVWQSYELWDPLTDFDMLPYLNRFVQDFCPVR